MNYKITHTTTYSYGELIPVCQNQVHLTPRETTHQQTRFHRLQIVPAPAQMIRKDDYFGNQGHFFAIEEAHRKLTITATSRVQVQSFVPPPLDETPPWEQVAATFESPSGRHELQNSQFRFDSPNVAITSAVREFALPSFPAGRPVLAAAMDLTHRIFTDFAYDPAATDVHTTVAQVLELQRGVCQDFAHLQIACLRSLGLPARYVSGYLRTIPPEGTPRLVGADASHAWLAVYCGERHGWIDLDPTNDVIPETDHVTIAWGRDYGDVCPIKGVVMGTGPHTMGVAVDVVPLKSKS